MAVFLRETERHGLEAQRFANGLADRHAGSNLRWIVVAVVLATALPIQIPIVLNPDLGWLLTLNEKILGGREFGVDIFESNPPLSAFMYMPAVIVGRMTRIVPEYVVIVLALAEIAGALFVVDRAMKSTGAAERERNASAWGLAFLLAILPGIVFGQREHIGVIALTPCVAITAMRRRNLDPGPMAIVAGAGAGLALAIKPYFAFVIAFPFLLEAARCRSFKPLLRPETGAILVVALCYAAVIALVFPDYLYKYSPLVAEAYLPVRRGIGALFVIPAVILGASILPLRLAARQNAHVWREAAPWLAASVGGAVAFVFQGKGWPYTAFACCTFALAALPLSLGGTPPRAPVAIAGAAILLMTGLYLSLQHGDFPPLAQRVKAITTHPRLLTITDHIGLGHPLVRQLEGNWVGGSCAQLNSGGAIWQEKYTQTSPSWRVKLDNVINSERRQLLADLRNGRPDVILVDSYLFSSFPFDWLAWAKSDPDVREELENYREVDNAGRVRILARRVAMQQE